MSKQAMQQAIEALQDAEEVLHFQKESKRLSTISPAIEALKAAIDETVKKETSKKNLEGLLAYANPGNRLEEYANHILTSCTRCGGSGCEQDAKAEQDEEPFGFYFEPTDLKDNWFYPFFKKNNGADFKTIAPAKVSDLYLHPAPRKPFVRLSEEEISELWGDWASGKTLIVQNFARSIEDALEEKSS